MLRLTARGQFLYPAVAWVDLVHIFEGERYPWFVFFLALLLSLVVCLTDFFFIYSAPAVRVAGDTGL